MQKNLCFPAPRGSLPHNLEVARQVRRQTLLAVLVKAPHVGYLAAVRKNRAKRVAAEDLADNAALTTVGKLLVFLFAFCSSNPAKGRLSVGSAQ